MPAAMRLRTLVVSKLRLETLDGSLSMTTAALSGLTETSSLRPLVEQAILDDRSNGLFKVNRAVFVDQAIFDLEQRLIFDRCWLYLGHMSEIPQPGRFVTRRVAGRPLIFCRDRQSNIRAFFNTCAHRGAVVCREKAGARHTFQCGYHGWVYDTAGTLIDVPNRESLSPCAFKDGALNLREVPKLAEFCGFVFVCFDADAGSLEDYLGGAREVLELASQHGDQGMEVVSGMHEYGLNANWKLMHENSADAYHTMTTHATYLDYVRSRDGEREAIDPAAAAGRARDLGNGHATIESEGMPWGRPYARWVKGWGDEAREEIDRIYEELVTRLGEKKGRFLARGDRNSLIFPNLVVNDTLAVIVRTTTPVSVGVCEVNGWALAPKGESPTSRNRRLRNFVEFFGPAGFATPDDVEMLELCQKGYANRSGAPWNDISRGMLKNEPAKNDELQMRTFWRQWHERVMSAGN